MGLRGAGPVGGVSQGEGGRAGMRCCSGANPARRGYAAASCRNIDQIESVAGWRKALSMCAVMGWVRDWVRIWS